MTTKSNNWIVAVVVLILTAAIFCFGYVMRGVWNTAPVPIHDTIYKIDTVEHHIISKYPYYISKIDTIIIRDTIPAKIDTTAILQKYYAWHYYTRTWNDSLISISLSDVVSENKVFDSDFSYKILKPSEIINNTIVNYSYSKYLYLGGSLSLPDAKWSSGGVYFASKRSMYGVGYIPYKNGVQLTCAIRLASFK